MSLLATGLFLSRSDAECVVDGLVRIGIATKDISLIISEEARSLHFKNNGACSRAEWPGRFDGCTGQHTHGTYTGEGGLNELSMAFADVVRNLFIPGVSLLAAGPLRNSLAIAGTRNLRRTFVEALIDMGIGENQARLYVSGLRAGGILVAVPVQPLCACEVQQIISSRSAWVG